MQNFKTKAQPLLGEKYVAHKEERKKEEEKNHKNTGSTCTPLGPTMFYYWKFCLWLTNFEPCDWSIVCQDWSEAAKRTSVQFHTTHWAEAAKRTSVQQLMIAAYNAAYKGSWSLPMFVVYTARFTVQVYTY